MAKFNNKNENYSQNCLQKIVAVVHSWSLFRGHLCNKSSKWDLKIVVIVDRLSLFGGGR